MKMDKQLSLKDRFTSKTPKFFTRLRNIGLAITAASTAIITAPIALPSLVISIASYLALAGGVISAVSQVTIEGE